MLEPLRVGFVGAGVFSTWAIYPALHLAPIDLRAICDLDEDRARSAAAAFGGGARVYTDHRTMLEREDLEAVIVWMRPNVGPALALDALQAGRHVLLPKPPALTLDGTRELAEAATRADRTVMVHFHRRFSHAISEARRIMATPSFGRLTQLSCSFCSGRYDAVRSAGYDDPVQAYLCDFAVHHLDLARWLGGEITELSLYHQADDAGGAAFAAAVRFASGAVGTLQLNSERVWWRNYDRIEITGQGEYLLLDGLWAYRHLTATANTFSDNYSDERTTELNGDGPALVEFVSAIRDGREPIASIHDAVRTMALYQAILDAARSGRQGPLELPRS
jgi:myo-inositol 2-dehydrogenase/D-chiro-inositol 1-dehydrogenase